MGLRPKLKNMLSHYCLDHQMLSEKVCHLQVAPIITEDLGKVLTYFSFIVKFRLDLSLHCEKDKKRLCFAHI